MTNPYSGLGAILWRMSRVTTPTGFVTLTGHRRNGGRKAGRRVFKRTRARTSTWWHKHFVEV